MYDSDKTYRLFTDFGSRSSKNEFQSLDNFIELFNRQNEKGKFKVEEISFKDLDQWNFDNDCLSHNSGKFFKIEGITVSTNFGNLHYWEQPIINQAEIGILGILTKVFNGTRYFLMQAKMEPGNINTLQLSPTVQATKSNFSLVHKGNAPHYLEYFVNRSKCKILIDQLQSEQGGRFLKKRNRNMIIEIEESIDVFDNFFWLTLAEIKKLLKIDNFVNMDARSVISTIPLISCYYDEGLYRKSDILSWYIDQKVKYELELERIPLISLNYWDFDDYSIHRDDKFFSVIAVKVEAKTREVSSWTQPMIKDLNIGLMGFIVKKIRGDYHFLVQAKVMPGNIDIIDLSPTVSCSNYIRSNPLFIEYFTGRKLAKILYNTIQSEEGGRFYHLQNRNMIVEIDEEEKIILPENYTWVSHNQMTDFMKHGMFNVEARSLISTIDFITY